MIYNKKRSLTKDPSIRDSSHQLLVNMRSRINDELHRKLNKVELLDKQELRLKMTQNLSEKMMNTLSEYERLKSVKAPEQKDEKRIADVLNRVGLAYLLLGEYKNGLKCFYECLNIRRRVYKNMPCSKQIGEVLNNIGVAFLRQCHNEKAIGHMKEALEIREAIYQVPNEYLIETLNNLTSAYYRKADAYYQEEYAIRALEKAEKYLKGDHPEYAKALNNLANFYFLKV